MTKLRELLLILKGVGIPKGALFTIAACIFFSTFLGFFRPLIIRNITDEGMIRLDFSVIVLSVCMLLAVVLIEQLVAVYQAKCFSEIHNTAKMIIFKKAFDKLMHIKIGYFDDRNSTEIISNLQMDIDRVTSVVDRNFIFNITNLFRVISGVAGLWVINWRLMLIVIMMIPFKYLCVFILARRKEAQTKEWVGAYRGFSSWLGDTVNGIREIKLWNLYQIKNDTFEEKQARVLHHQKNGVLLDSWNSFFELMLEWIVMGILYILGGVLLIQEEVTIGGIIAFFSYSSYVTAPIASIMNVRYLLSQIYPSSDRLRAFLALEEEEATQKGLSMMNDFEEVCFHNLSFCYQKDRLILDQVNLSIYRGEKIAIIGANGSGKSTMIKLLLRFIEPTQGCIAVNGVDIRKMNLYTYRDLFAVVSQDIYLFFDTVRNNTDLLCTSGENELCNAYRQSGALKFISNMPENKNSMIGNNGIKISGGEKQKLAVARAIIKDTPIVIFDEANSGLDKDSDAYLHEIIRQELFDKTVIMITHRCDNLEYMDQVYKLVDGRLFGL